MANPAIEIRDYKDSDYEMLVECLKEGNLFDEAWDSRLSLQNKNHLAPGSIIVACVDGKVIGNIYIMADGWGVGFIWRLCVRKSFRGKGIGSSLLKESENRLRHRDCREVYLFVNETDTELKDFYKCQHGYILAGLWRGMYKDLG